jgi:hypothetical protein
MTTNLTVNITVTTPEAAAALLHGLGLPLQEMPPAAINPVTVPAPMAAYPGVATQPTSANTAAQIQSSLPVSIAPPSPMPATPATMPVPTSAPGYTYEDLARAAAPLMDAGKTPDLQAQLRSFGVQALTQLPKEQYGAFATALRGMGARI